MFYADLNKIESRNKKIFCSSHSHSCCDYRTGSILRIKEESEIAFPKIGTVFKKMVWMLANFWGLKDVQNVLIGSPLFFLEH